MCDCGSRVHPGIACSGVGCRCHVDHITVPIKIDGIVVGKAVITEHGQIITANLDAGDSGIGREIRDVFLYGLADSISFKPNFISATNKG